MAIGFKVRERVMRVRQIAKTMALKFPPVRRLFGEAARLRKANAELQSDLSALGEERNRLGQELGVARDELETLRLQVYTLRSDFQRAVNRNEELRDTLQRMEQEADNTATGGIGAGGANQRLVKQVEGIFTEVDALRKELRTSRAVKR
jgi:chromosome segregation ATPase